MNLMRAHSTVAAGFAFVAAATAIGGIAIEEKPASLVTSNLIMHAGRPFVPLGELARALGGSGRYDPVRLRYEIQPGAAGVLLVNPGALGALLPAPGARGGAPATHQNSVRLGIGGREVMIEGSELVLLRPTDPAVSLNFLARLLGGQARFDPGRAAWVLPPGGPGSPLRFR